MSANFVFVATAVLAGSMLAAATPSPPATHYRTCAQLNAKWPHGVGKAFAIDQVTGKTKRVRDFHISTALYTANKKFDTDHDGIACERY